MTQVRTFCLGTRFNIDPSLHVLLRQNVNTCITIGLSNMFRTQLLCNMGEGTLKPHSIDIKLIHQLLTHSINSKLSHQLHIHYINFKIINQLQTHPSTWNSLINFKLTPSTWNSKQIQQHIRKRYHTQLWTKNGKDFINWQKRSCTMASTKQYNIALKLWQDAKGWKKMTNWNWDGFTKINNEM